MVGSVEDPVVVPELAAELLALASNLFSFAQTMLEAKATANAHVVFIVVVCCV